MKITIDTDLKQIQIHNVENLKEFITFLKDHSIDIEEYKIVPTNYPYYWYSQPYHYGTISTTQSPTVKLADNSVYCGGIYGDVGTAQTLNSPKITN